MASCWFSFLFAVEVPVRPWQAEGTERNPTADPRDESRQSSLGCSPHSWRTSQARHRRGSDFGRQVHGEAQATSVARLENVPLEPCQWDRLDRPVRCSNHLISPAVWVVNSPTRQKAYSLARHHSAPNCRMGRPPSYRGLRLGISAKLPHSRPRPRLWRCIYSADSRDGHSRQTNSAAIALAERTRRTTDRLDKTRVP
jgi:hypothetical protein